MAALTGAGPARSAVVGTGGAIQVGFVTRFAVSVSAFVVSDLSPRMASKTSHTDVGADERKPGERMPGKLSLRDPGAFIVALLTIGTEFTLMRIRVTAAAAALCEDGHRAAIIVAAETLRRLMGTVERHSGLPGMVKCKVAAERVPVVTHMAE